MTDELELLLGEEQEEPETVLDLLTIKTVRMLPQTVDGEADAVGDTGTGENTTVGGSLPMAADAGESTTTVGGSFPTAADAGENTTVGGSLPTAADAGESTTVGGSLPAAADAGKNATVGGSLPAAADVGENAAVAGNLLEVIGVGLQVGSAVLTMERAKVASIGEESLQTGGQAEDNARSFYQNLKRVRRAAGTLVQSLANSKIPLIRETGQGGGTDRDVLRLDRAFQRDARRYDGGFTWQ